MTTKRTVEKNLPPTSSDFKAYKLLKDHTCIMNGMFRVLDLFFANTVISEMNETVWQFVVSQIVLN